MNQIDIELWSGFKLKPGVTHVLCGFDPNFNFTKGLILFKNIFINFFEKVCQAASYLKKGAKFIATNMDETLPLDASELCLPDVGAMVASVSKATSRQVDVVCGKPSSLAFDLIRAEHDGVEADSSGFN